MNRLSRILNSASLAGIASFAMFLIYYYVLGANPLGPIKYLGLFVPILFFSLSLKKFREHDLNGYMTFAEAFLPAVVFTFVYSSLAAMLMYFYISFIDLDILAFYKEDNLKQIGLTKDLFVEYMGKDAYQELIDQIQDQTIGSLSFGDFWSKLLSTSVFSLIIAAILKKNPPPVANTYE